MQLRYSTCLLFDNDFDNFKTLKELLLLDTEPRKNLTYLTHLFFIRAQGQTESIDANVTDLKQ